MPKHDAAGPDLATANVIANAMSNIARALLAHKKRHYAPG
jgi:hypothetical protein